MLEHVAPIPAYVTLLRLEGKMFEPHRIADLVFEFHVNSFTYISTRMRHQTNIKVAIQSKTREKQHL